MPVISAMTVVSTTLGRSIGFIWKETKVVEKEVNFKELPTALKIHGGCCFSGFNRLFQTFFTVQIKFCRNFKILNFGTY